MSLSVIIPTLNEERYIAALLDSTRGELPMDAEVIVVDASDNHKTISAAKDAGVGINLRFLKSSTADVGLQRNLGAASARFPYLLFLDADVLLGKDVVSRAMARIEEDALCIVSVRHVPDRSTLRLRATLALVDGLVLVARLTKRPVTNGDFLLTNRRTFTALNGFRVGGLLGEDTDFGYRAHQLGASNPIERRGFVTASSRRLSAMPARRIVFQWAAAYIAVLRGSGVSGVRCDDTRYPYGLWGGDLRPAQSRSNGTTTSS